eukprot:scaffold7039_cov110-Cylindrotheca_fusiformis.AAC.1
MGQGGRTFSPGVHDEVRGVEHGTAIVALPRVLPLLIPGVPGARMPGAPDPHASMSTRCWSSLANISGPS